MWRGHSCPRVLLCFCTFHQRGIASITTCVDPCQSVAVFSSIDNRQSEISNTEGVPHVCAPFANVGERTACTTGGGTIDRSNGPFLTQLLENDRLKLFLFPPLVISSEDRLNEGGPSRETCCCCRWTCVLQGCVARTFLSAGAPRLHGFRRRGIASIPTRVAPCQSVACVL